MKSFGALPLVFLSVFSCGGLSPRAAPPSTAAASVTSGSPAEGPAHDENEGVPAAMGHPTWGNPAALVTIVEFADFECPYCVQAEASLARVRRTYGADMVRIVWKNMPLPFHVNAMPAAEAAMGVFATKGNDAFWRFHDAALEGVGPLGATRQAVAGGEDIATLAYSKWAKDAGVQDTGSFRSGLAAGKWAEAVTRDQREASALGVVGTPSFFVNGSRVVGAQPFETFQTLIDGQIRAAKSKLAAGTPADRLYAVLSRENVAHDKRAEDDEDGGGADAKAVYWVPVGKSPSRGSSDALVTIVEFADYECPFCSRAEGTVKALSDEYGDRLRIVFKDAPLPFHPRAEPAAQAALEVRAEKGDAAFWAMHDALLDNQQSLDDRTLTELATRQGARAEAVGKAIAKHSHARAIDDDLALADDLQAGGTPHFFINGRRLVGAQSKEKFEALINEETARARVLLSGGTKPAALYEALVADGVRAPEPEKKAVASAALLSGRPARGNGAAHVTIHEWSDFECPFCARAETTLERVLGQYPDDVKLVWHDLPLPMHAFAPLAAQAAREALRQKGSGAFWAIHDQMLHHQKALDREALDGYARNLGLDMLRWKAALDGETRSAEMESDRKAASELGISGTPAFVIVPKGAASGYFVSGAQGYAKFRKLIERALAEAK